MFNDSVLAAQQAHTDSPSMSQSDLKSLEFCQNHFRDRLSTQNCQKKY